MVRFTDQITGTVKTNYRPFYIIESMVKNHETMKSMYVLCTGKSNT